MQFDLAKDLIIISGWVLNLSTVMIWASAMVAFIFNFIYNRRLYMSQYREGKLADIARSAFTAAEKVAKLTPMKSDDKLLFFIKRSIKAYQAVFKHLPSEAEIKVLQSKAAELADADKLETIKFKDIQKETPVSVAMSAALPIESVAVVGLEAPKKKAAPKKAAVKKAAPKKKGAK